MEIEKEIAILQNQMSEIQEMIKISLEHFREEQDLKSQKKQSKLEEKENETKK